MATTPSNNFDFQNYYSATLQSDITASSLSLTLDTVPTPVEGILVIEPDSTTNREIIFYTGKTSSTITLPVDGRGWDGTTATTHLAGSPIIMAPVAYMLRMLKSGSMFDTTKTGWTALGTSPSYSANNGQKEYVFSTPSDLTGTLAKGMKLKFDRPAGTPTQSMAFVAASSQYATKTSPSGLAFSSAFTCEAWVYINSYTGGYIISRKSGVSAGWDMEMLASGQLRVFYGDGTNTTVIDTFQSIPQKQWVHVAGVVTSASSKSGAIYINGISVPINSAAASSATSFTQSGNLTIGAYTGGTASNFFDGYISEARVWSVAQSQSSVQANMAISLTGSETNLVALFQGNGNFNDKTSNANSLTATGGAIATQATNPYNSTEYGVVTGITSSTLTVFMGTDYNVPSTGTLANFYYSTARAPFGFPAQRSKWRAEAYFFGDTGSLAVSSFNNQMDSNYRLTIPSGEWLMGWKFTIITTGSSAASMTAKPNVTLASNPSISSTGVISIDRYTSGGAAVTEIESNFTGVNRQLSLTVFQTYGLFNTVETAGGTVTWRIPNTAIGTEVSRMYAECAYL